MCLAWEGKGGKERAGLGCEEQRRQQQSNEATKGLGRSTLKMNLSLFHPIRATKLIRFRILRHQNMDISHTFEGLSDQI